MTIVAGGWNIGSYMVWIFRLVVIGLVTTHTRLGSIVIVPARVTAEAISSRMTTRQWIVVAVDRESCGCPAGAGRMAIVACGWYIGSYMVWIGRVVKICLVATYTGIRCVVIISSRMTAETICGSMGSGQWVIVSMDRECCGRPSWLCGMTLIACIWNTCSYMVRVGSRIEILQMAGGTLPRHL